MDESRVKALATVEQAIVDIETQMTSQIWRIDQLAASQSAAKAVLQSMRNLLGDLYAQRSSIIDSNPE
ncbi:hypothetical protein ACEPT7_00715 [Burkholderia ubonensis]|uniref:hypothetical protein n=1 Tax=Burkholderia ubonensis TaxID=101571 RepID=UPI00358DDB2D